MSIHFTQKAQQALNLAMQIAAELGHTYIGSEHLLMGLIEESTGVAAHYLTEKGASPEKLRNAVVRMAGTGSPANISGADMTPRTKSIIENSLACAQTYGQNYIGTEHLLLSLLEERDCVAVRILESLEVATADLRRDLADFLNNAGQSSEGAEMPRGASGGKNSRQKDGKSSLDASLTLK
ncbi:MAG: ATP-dependent Clp protease ATP-binding subunit, partial [Clostridia bacterium]|nr:ATP-dependent Clp protease ATP-binding subunit [Clostridia bacterium]